MAIHSYILFPLFSRDNELIFSRSLDNESLFSRDNDIINSKSPENKYIKSLQETSFSVPMSEEQEHIDHCLTHILNQGLIQADIALCLAIIDNIHINVCNLKRRLARLQLYRWRNLSGSDVVASPLNDGQTL